MPVPLYDYEAYRIQDIIVGVQRKWFGKSNTMENLMALSNEITDRLEDYGFHAIVDVTPCLVDEPIEVRVESRIDKSHQFDRELKGHEVKKSRENGGI